MSALCSRCKAAPPKEYQRYCPPCIAAYMRDWRARKAEKLRAMMAELDALKKGQRRRAA